MTTELANYFYDLDRSVLVALLEDYAKEKGAKVRPSVRTVKSVAAYLGHRQHYRDVHKAVCVDESRDQIMRAVDIGSSAVANALQFLTWTGYLETLKHGGGRGKKPTVRLVYDSTSTQRAITHSVGNPTQRDLVSTQRDLVSTEWAITRNTKRVTKRDTNSVETANSRCVAVIDIDEVIARTPTPMPDHVRAQWQLMLKKGRSNPPPPARNPR